MFKWHILTRPLLAVVFTHSPHRLLRNRPGTCLGRARLQQAFE
jgi:hypothetical protein